MIQVNISLECFENSMKLMGFKAAEALGPELSEMTGQKGRSKKSLRFSSDI